MDNGYIRLWRTLLNSTLWSLRSDDLKLAVYLILAANWKSGKWSDGAKIVQVERGQHITSIQTLAKKTGLSFKNIRTSLKHLENIDFLARERANKYTHVTICNYDHYNPPKKKGGTKTAPKGHGGGTEAATIEEGVEGKEETLMQDVPKELKDLELYRVDGKLCKKWPEIFPQWCKRYSDMGVLAEIIRAHQWEVDNPAKRKKDRQRYLGTWLASAFQKGTYAKQRVVRPSGPRASKELDDYLDRRSAKGQGKE